MRRAIPLLVALCAGLLQADVTVRYTSDFQGSLGAAMQKSAPQLQSLLPKGTVLRIKGSKSYAEYGSLHAITDSSTRKVILLDPDGKKFAIGDADQYVQATAAAVPKMHDAVAAMMAAFQFKTEVKLTGRTAIIQGIDSEERQVEVSMEGPSLPNMPPGPLMRLVMQVWLSKESEIENNPALREWAAYNRSAVAGMSTTDSLKKLFAMLPGMSNGLGGALKDMARPNSVIMRTHMELFMPLLAAAAKQMPAGNNPLGANLDPNAPMMQLDQQVAEISTGAVPDSQFEVPKDYTEVTMDEYMKALMGRVVPAEGGAPAK